MGKAILSSPAREDMPRSSDETPETLALTPSSSRSHSTHSGTTFQSTSRNLDPEDNNGPSSNQTPSNFREFHILNYAYRYQTTGGYIKDVKHDTIRIRDDGSSMSSGCVVESLLSLGGTIGLNEIADIIEKESKMKGQTMMITSLEVEETFDAIFQGSERWFSEIVFDLAPASQDCRQLYYCKGLSSDEKHHGEEGTYPWQLFNIKPGDTDDGFWGRSAKEVIRDTMSFRSIYHLKTILNAIEEECGDPVVLVNLHEDFAEIGSFVNHLPFYALQALLVTDSFTSSSERFKQKSLDKHYPGQKPLSLLVADTEEDSQPSQDILRTYSHLNTDQRCALKGFIETLSGPTRKELMLRRLSFCKKECRITRELQDHYDKTMWRWAQSFEAKTLLVEVDACT
ncbi:hypothetical protein BJ508DRAFT_52269 [Ascobolus immersus RN42]|uniref:Uncharacterized protein n=1 Tax=Ascobolus immersus RN42 TaxID=1160509 RepID=A0A3N4II81_ASCIM|nr:hypothetical protein BJ508DRAFT_52269 [Ascobolus immersus RN42]